MNQQKLQEGVDWVKNEVGDALVATDIWTDGGKSLAGANFQKAIDCFDEVTTFIHKQIQGAGGALPPPGRYYAVEFVDHKVAIVFVQGGLQWGLVVDTTKIDMGRVIALAKDVTARLEAARS